MHAQMCFTIILDIVKLWWSTGSIWFPSQKYFTYSNSSTEAKNTNNNESVLETMCCDHNLMYSYLPLLMWSEVVCLSAYQTVLTLMVYIRTDQYEPFYNYKGSVAVYKCIIYKKVSKHTTIQNKIKRNFKFKCHEEEWIMLQFLLMFCINQITETCTYD